MEYLAKITWLMFLKKFSFLHVFKECFKQYIYSDLIYYILKKR